VLTPHHKYFHSAEIFSSPQLTHTTNFLKHATLIHTRQSFNPPSTTSATFVTSTYYSKRVISAEMKIINMILAVAFGLLATAAW
jgi:hypothetical protein